VALALNKDPKVARIVKGRLEKTTLGQVAESIKVIFRPAMAFIEVALDVKVGLHEKREGL
jgi:DNA-directed RNA polymerase III subunit RPC1